jgi:hypothetical protein
VPRRPLHAAKHRAQPGVEHSRLHRFDDVVVGAGLQADDHIDVIAPRGQQDDRQRVVHPDPPAHLHTVDAGQHHVQDDDLRPLRAYLGQPQLAGLARGHRMTEPGQRELQGRSRGRIVLDEQDCRHESPLLGRARYVLGHRRYVTGL